MPPSDFRRTACVTVVVLGLQQRMVGSEALNVTWKKV